MATVITGHIDNAGQVLGVHGGDGAMSWLRAATGSHLYSDWDGIEWVAFEPGGRAGLHTHSHTEEIWFFLGGSGELELNGQRHEMSPGTIVLTPLHSNHAAWNTGDEPLQYVVIEVFPPAIRDALPLRRPTDEIHASSPSPHSERHVEPTATQSPGGYVGRLEPESSLAAHPYFDGAWESFERRTVRASDDYVFDASHHEYAVYVMSGAGTFTAGNAVDRFRTGSVLTVGWGAELALHANEDVELFITTLVVHQ